MIVCLYFFDLRALGILIISEAQVKDDSNLTQRGGGASPHSPTSELRRTRDVTYRVLSLGHGFRNVNESTGGVTWNDSTIFSDPRSVVPFFYI